MSTSRKVVDIARQGALFLVRDVGKRAIIDRKSVTPGSLDLDAQIREMVTQGLKQTPLSRPEVAAHMSLALGRDFTKAMLDTFSAESKGGHRLPAAYAPAFAVVTGDAAIISLLCQAAGGAFVPDAEILKIELHRLQGERRELKEKEQLIKQLIEALGEATK
jgi:hypothetical protein